MEIKWPSYADTKSLVCLTPLIGSYSTLCSKLKFNPFLAPQQIFFDIFLLETERENMKKSLKCFDEGK